MEITIKDLENNLKTLPKELLGNVNDYIDFLKEKAQAVAYRVTRMVAKNKALKLMEEVGIPEP